MRFRSSKTRSDLIRFLKMVSIVTKLVLVKTGIGIMALCCAVVCLGCPTQAVSDYFKRLEGAYYQSAVHKHRRLGLEMEFAPPRGENEAYFQNMGEFERFVFFSGLKSQIMSAKIGFQNGFMIPAAELSRWYQKRPPFSIHRGPILVLETPRKAIFIVYIDDFALELSSSPVGVTPKLKTETLAMFLRVLHLFYDLGFSGTQSSQQPVGFQVNVSMDTDNAGAVGSLFSHWNRFRHLWWNRFRPASWRQEFIQPISQLFKNTCFAQPEPFGALVNVYVNNSNSPWSAQFDLNFSHLIYAWMAERMPELADPRACTRKAIEVRIFNTPSPDLGDGVDQELKAMIRASVSLIEGAFDRYKRLWQKPSP